MYVGSKMLNVEAVVLVDASHTQHN
jgi:hypothetical protein